MVASLSSQFFDSHQRLDAVPAKRVMLAIQKFNQDRNHPSLNLHPVNSDSSGRLFTFRASDSLRVLAARCDDDHWVILDAGNHDDVYAIANLGSFTAALNGQFIGLAMPGEPGIAPISHGQGPPKSRRKKTKGRSGSGASSGVLSHWADFELESVGFENEEIKHLRTLNSVNELLNLDEKIADDRLLLAIDLTEVTPEKYHERSQAGEPARASSAELVASVEEFGGDFGLSSFLSAEEFERLMSAPIERWMLFLHPKQRALVSRTYEGPARIGGPAGTGKTSVALHRAAALAQKFREQDPAAKILFTTFISSLPPVLESLYNQLPNAIPGAVDFIHVDGLARQVCKEMGVDRPTTKAVDENFKTAYEAVAKPGSPLANSILDSKYVRTEIDAVIKGRGIETFVDYVDLERTGRRVPMLPSIRQEVWNVMKMFDELNEDAGAIDYSDRIALAYRSLKGKKSRYRAAIVDESQDLSLMGLQLVRRLVNGTGNDPSDGLLLVGDGAQRIYASCFTLRQAGLEVRGRSTILEMNYRNTPEVIAAALAVAGDREIDDLGEVQKRRVDTTNALPSGEVPRLVIVDSAADSSDYIASRIEELVEEHGFGLGDIAVLAPLKRVTWAVVKSLNEAGLAAVELRKYDGTIDPTVKVGTFHRAKGLEFKAVILAGMDSFPRKQGKNESDDAYEERLDLDLSALFVAMTRAREVLDLVAIGEPSDAVDQAEEFFDRFIYE
jgi:hypothetical protein